LGPSNPPNLAVLLRRWQNTDKPILIAAKCIGRKLILASGAQTGIRIGTKEKGHRNR
jgi:hypothetical protein